MDFKLRGLTTPDLVKMINIVSKFGVKEFKRIFDPDFARRFVKENGDVDLEQLKSLLGINMMIEVADIIFANIGKCADDVYEFCADIGGMSVEEVKALSPAMFYRLVTMILKSKDFSDFFAEVLKSFE